MTEIEMSLAPSSPRLPSPPPPAEIQIGPKSPSMVGGGGTPAGRNAQQMEQTVIDANARRRIHPGTKAADMAAGPPLIPLSELDSAFQLQEHLAALHYYHSSSNTVPITRSTAALLATPPAATDRTLWLYELCRFLIGKCNSLIVGFLFDTPPCSAATCPEMRASEWQFLCAVHDQPRSCCAIDYCCHTLDWAANVVTNPKIFPSRFVALSDAHDRGAANKNLVNVFRRLHRIFAHAWFQHRGVFWSVEAQSGLYVFFKTVCDIYDLLPAENYKLPPEAEGLEAALTASGQTPQDAPITPATPSTPAVPSGDRRGSTLNTPIVTRPGQGLPLGSSAAAAAAAAAAAIAASSSPMLSQGQDQGHLGGVDLSAHNTNTRRHIRSSPSVGSAVPTVQEADEEDGAAAGAGPAAASGKLPETVPEEAETTPAGQGTKDGEDVPAAKAADAAAADVANKLRELSISGGATATKASGGRKPADEEEDNLSDEEEDEKLLRGDGEGALYAASAPPAAPSPPSRPASLSHPPASASASAAAASTAPPPAPVPTVVETPAAPLLGGGGDSDDSDDGELVESADAEVAEVPVIVDDAVLQPLQQHKPSAPAPPPPSAQSSGATTTAIVEIGEADDDDDTAAGPEAAEMATKLALPTLLDPVALSASLAEIAGNKAAEKSEEPKLVADEKEDKITTPAPVTAASTEALLAKTEVHDFAAEAEEKKGTETNTTSGKEVATGATSSGDDGAED